MKKLKETAAGGSTAAHSIAVRTDGNRIGGMQSRPLGLKDFMVQFYSKVNNRNKFHTVKLESSISNMEKLTEASDHPFQYTDALSKFKGAEMDGEYDQRDTVSFGIEDDSGAFMKITVPLVQAEKFETRVAQALAEVQEFKKTGRGEDKSLAELLYELKDQFTIVSAEFPTIPKDAIYNASQIDEQPETNDDEDVDFDPEEGDEESGDEFGDAEDVDAGDEVEGDEEMDLDDEEIGDDFDEESAGTDKEELLQSVLSMIKSNNEKEIAEYRAEEEKAKARQAELAMKSAQQTQAEQEQMVAAQAEMEAHKDAEKKAKEMADMVKFKYKKKKGLMDSYKPPFTRILREFNEQESVGSLRRQMAMIPQKYQTDPSDDPETRRYKNQMMGLEQRNMRLRMRAAQMREREEQRQRNKEQEQEQNQERGQDQEQRGSNQMTRPNSTQARQQAQGQQPNGDEL